MAVAWEMQHRGAVEEEKEVGNVQLWMVVGCCWAASEYNSGRADGRTHRHKHTHTRIHTQLYPWDQEVG